MKPIHSFVKSTINYEQQLRSHVAIVEADLDLKHRQMAQKLNKFLRGECYRSDELFEIIVPAVAQAPIVLGVDDLHAQNFGTWIDVEQRLVYGINDFDEAYLIPYTKDLTRLAESVLIRADAGKLLVSPSEACLAILDGYRHRLKNGARPIFVDDNSELAIMLAKQPADQRLFWKKMRSLEKDYAAKTDAVHGLKQLLPQGELKYRIATRTAGVGSLGRKRFVLLSSWRGADIAFEAKTIAPASSYLVGCSNSRHEQRSYVAEMLALETRSPDAITRVVDNWMLRSLSPQHRRIEITKLETASQERALLRLWGADTANIHLATPGAAREILRDLDRRSSNWLHLAARLMSNQLQQDWRQWQQHMKTK